MKILVRVNVPNTKGKKIFNKSSELFSRSYKPVPSPNKKFITYSSTVTYNFLFFYLLSLQYYLQSFANTEINIWGLIVDLATNNVFSINPLHLLYAYIRYDSGFVTLKPRFLSYDPRWLSILFSYFFPRSSKSFK